MSITLVDDNLLRKHCYNRVGLVNIQEIEKIRVKKIMTLKDFRREYSINHKIPLERIRIWNWILRKNKTLRPDKPFEEYDLQQSFVDLESSFPENIYYVEVSQKSHPPYFYQDESDAILLFLKQYDPKGNLSFLQSITVSYHTKVSNILSSNSENIRIYEEVKPDLLLEPNLDATFLEEGFVSGDILVFEEIRFDSPLSKSCSEWYQTVLYSIWVKFQNQKFPQETFSLFLSQKLLLPDIIQQIALHLNCDVSSLVLQPQIDISPSQLSLEVLLRQSRGIIYYERMIEQ